MSTTLFAAIALVGSLSVSANPDFRAHTDYTAAQRVAATEKKPMAVLIGKGDQFGKLMADVSMSADAAKLLREKFVCVTVDVDTPAGAKLAGEFQLTEGLVISSAGGDYQALRQPGAVTATDLVKHTSTYATSTGTPATTVTVGVPAQPVYTGSPVIYGSSCPGGTCGVPARPVIYGSSCPGGTCGTVAPAGYTFPSYPAYQSFPSAPFYGSSCPNGRCPTVR